MWLSRLESTGTCQAAGSVGKGTHSLREVMVEIHINNLVVLAALSPIVKAYVLHQNKCEFRGNELGCIRVQSDRCLLFTAFLLCALVCWRPDEKLHDKAASWKSPHTLAASNHVASATALPPVSHC